MTASRSRHLVDPELAGLLDLFPTIALSEETLPATRARQPLMPVDPAAIEQVDLSRRTIPGPDGAPDLDILVHSPRKPASARPCIFHIHGGGYVGGSAEGVEAMLRPLAASLDCVITSVNYRLAPETRFPGAVEDCYAALAWVFKNAADLGVDPTRIGVKGESAGGGLAAALALLARDRGEYKLAFQSLTYPMLDDRTCVGDQHPHTGEYIWTPHNNAFGWRALLGVEPGSEGVSPYAAPGRAESLAGLPPTFITTGSLDLFLEEDLEYARRLVRDGVPCELHVYPGGFHAFDIVPGAAVSAASRRDTRESLRRALYPG
jgi:triacylglycerol lipase